MFVVSSRSLTALKHGRTAKLLGKWKAEELRAEFFHGSIRHYHISLMRRLNPSNSLRFSVVERNGAGHSKRVSAMIWNSPKFASTFVVESPGKSTNSVDNQPTQSSTQPSTSTVEFTDPIPEPPAIPIPDVTNIIDVSGQVANVAGETSFASLGLGGWSPVGIVENCMEYLHIDCGMPWWSAIALGTVVVRMLLFPVVLISQRNGAKLNNNLPQMQLLQMKMTEARQSCNHLEAARYAQELMRFMKEKDLNPLKNMIVPLAQAPIFISFFMGLRSMANTPVPSLTSGGMLWFTDLTMPDQFFLLPLITSATLYLTIEIGTDTARVSSQNAQTMRFILRALPIIIFPFTLNFPAAVLCYWTSSNFISLLQVGFLRIPKVRKYFKIDPLVHHDPNTLPQKPKPFVQGFKETWTNMKITRELEARERFDEMQFKRAGTAPLQKTFKYDPTQPRAIAAKKRPDS